MDKVEIRCAQPADAAELLAVYAPYIATPVTFEVDLPGIEEFSDRIRAYGAFYPYLVCAVDGVAVGYAYAHAQMERAAYRWNAELSVYIRPECTGRGVGKALYLTVLDILRLQYIRNVYAGVTLPNPASERLHYSLGFTLLGVYRRTGYKAEKWHDVGWFEKTLETGDEKPPEPRSIQHIGGRNVQQLLHRHSDLIQDSAR